MRAEAEVGVQASTLPSWTSALAVVAHPDDESFALGAVLDALVQSGCHVSVLCLTRGEASTVHGISGDLRALRAMELEDAAARLGLTSAELSDHPDGALARVKQETLVREVIQTARRTGARGLVVFDPAGVTGHPDHIAATEAAMAAAADLSLPILGWTLPDGVAEQLNHEFGTTFIGHDPAQIDLAVPVSRDKQRTASLAHASQAVPTSVLWRRLELLGDVEHLRWLQGPDARGPRSTSSTQVTPDPADLASMRVDYCDGDRFEISIRDHFVTVDQPTDIGGDDLGPTPTELVRRRSRVVCRVLRPPLPAPAQARRVRALCGDVLRDGSEARSGVARGAPDPPAAGSPARTPRGAVGGGGALHRAPLDHDGARDRGQLLRPAEGPPQAGPVDRAGAPWSTGPCMLSSAGRAC